MESSCFIVDLFGGSSNFNNSYWEDFYYNIDTFEDRCYFNVDNFEDCYCTDGHEEDSYLNDGQGVYETPGAYLEAPITIAGKRSGPSSRSRPSYTHTRTGAKVGFNCTPKVQVTIKPEETTRQDEKGIRNY